MLSREEGSAVSGARPKQLRSPTRTEVPRGGNAATRALSDRVGKPGLSRQACMECHRRKVKCDMTTKTRCSSCEKLNIPCSVNEYRRRRNKEKRSKIDQLESNIERMENVFEQLGLMQPGKDFDATSSSTLYTQSHCDLEMSTLPRPENDDIAWDSEGESEPENFDSTANWSSMHVSDKDSKKPTDGNGRERHDFWTNLVLSHSVIEFPSDRERATRPGHQKGQSLWKQINPELESQFLQTEDASVLPGPDLPDYGELPYNKPVDPALHHDTLYPLPGFSETMVLFLEYLENFNSLCPLFQPSSLFSICEEHKTIDPSQADQWACMNVVLSLAYSTRSKCSDVTQSNYQFSWMFMKNALHVADRLCSGPPTLWAAQALLGMSFILLGTLSNTPCDRLITSALQISHRLLMNDAGNTEDMKHCRIVFWLAYCVDREHCLRFARPCGRSDNGMDIELSATLSQDLDVAPSEYEDALFDVLRSFCKLSEIKEKICRFLFSAATNEQPISGLANSLVTLDQRLREWKENVPQKYRPDVEDAHSLADSRVLVVLLGLHLSYFNCLLSVHQVIQTHGPRINMELARSHSSGLLSEDIALLSGILCQNAARASIKLTKNIPPDNPFLIGILVHYVVAATTTLSRYIAHDPGFKSRAWDVKLINQAELFLSSAVLTAPNDGMRRMVKLCSDYRYMAESAVNRVGDLPSVA